MDWHIILIAVAVSASIHTSAEPINVIRKVRRLKTALKTGKLEELPMKGIDTRAKSYALGVALLVIPAVIAYLIANTINPGVESAIQFSVAIIIVAELILMARLDVYHVEIERLTQTAAKKKK